MKASESWCLNLKCVIVVAVTKICDLKWQGRDNSSLVTRRIVFSWNRCLEICKYNLRRVTSLCFFSEGISGIGRKSRYPRNSRGSSKFLFHSYNLKIWGKSHQLSPNIHCLSLRVEVWGLKRAQGMAWSQGPSLGESLWNSHGFGPCR